MKLRPGRLPLLAALICFAVFFANVVAGAFRLGAFFGDVSEMLTLFAASILFVVGVLEKEAAARSGER
jgi:hypothetical protein